MKRFLIVSLIVLIAGTLCTGQVNATPFSTPPPYTIGGTTLTFGSDVDIGLFSPSSSVVSVELFDVADGFGTGSAFGFYFASNPANLYTIFGILEGPAIQIATIDFANGQILDSDSGGIQSTFTAGSGNIGFFLLPIYGSGLPILYTEPVLNPTGIDVSGTFPIISTSESDDYLITYKLPIEGNPTIYANLSFGVTPVPEPSTFLFMAFGLGGLLIYKRRRMK
jgi:hypothetical protein